MNNKQLIFSILFIAISLFSYTQNNMYIHKTDGSVQTISLSSIDSIKYTYGSNNPLTTTGAGVTFDGFTYTSVILGNGQEWMVENLRTSVYANGDSIINITSNVFWDDGTTGAWCHYDNDNQYEALFGKFYNWYTAVDSRNVCPTGWHVPSDLEWDNLLYFVDPNANIINGNIAGGKLKSTGNVDDGDGLWDAPNNAATNDFNFYGYPGGQRDSDNGGLSFSNSITRRAYWWSTKEEDNENAFFRVLKYDNEYLGRAANNKTNGFSIRCLKD